MLKTTKGNVLLPVISICVILVLGFSTAAAVKKYYTHKEVSRLNAGYKVLNTVNTYFIPGKNAMLAAKPVEESGLYKVELTLDNVTQPFYITMDGKFLIFTDGMVEVEKLKKVAAANKQAKKEDMVKTQKPMVELFIMSLCPYGSRAEAKIFPIIQPFGDKIDFKLRFIVDVNGASINDVSSLHGIDEAKEDARQAAIFRYYPGKFASYITKMNEKPCDNAPQGVELDKCFKRAATSLKIDVKKIEKFAYGQEAIAVFKEDSAAGVKYNASASPTLVINGVKSDAIYKDEKAIKEAICSAFANIPEVCQKEK